MNRNVFQKKIEYVVQIFQEEKDFYSFSLMISISFGSHTPKSAPA